MASEKTERKLPSRRRKASKGKVIRVSTLVYEFLDKQRFGKSWDQLFRRVCALPDRDGIVQPLVEGILEQESGKFFLRVPGTSWAQLEENAYEQAFLTAARRKVKQVSKPIRLREIA